MAEQLKPCDPKLIFKQYENGIQYKNSLGLKGMYEQNKVNERFYVGDQWYGAKCGNDRPLVRQNIIKRIGDYKMAVVCAAPISVNYSAEGVPDTVGMRGRIRAIKEALVNAQTETPLMDMGEPSKELATGEEISLVMSAMSEYFKVSAERLKFDDMKNRVLRKAYKTGTGILYTYWDDTIRTGLYADASRKKPLVGDISAEVLDVENVYFGDPAELDVQRQPYIIIAQRKSVEELKRIAKKNRRPADEIDLIKPDEQTQYMAGQRSETELQDAEKATVLTKMWKEWNEEGNEYTIKAVQVVKGATIRKEWDMKVRLYPVAKFVWEERDNCTYGESEITYLVPNQIAINRMLTANVWALIMMGMPIMIVNGDVIQQPVTNDPGQVIKVYGGAEDVHQSIGYVNPPNFSPNFGNNVNDLIQNTLSSSGANDAALGNLTPENTSAIIAVREAATMPLSVTQQRFYMFCEDVARIWAEFWVSMYGVRQLKIEDESGSWYVFFDGDKYRDLLISSKVDVGASSLWSESNAIRTLDNLFDRGVIDVVQYLKRLPSGTIQNVNGLIRELEQAVSAGKMQNAAPAVGNAPANPIQMPTAEQIPMPMPMQMEQPIEKPMEQPMPFPAV